MNMHDVRWDINTHTRTPRQGRSSETTNRLKTTYPKQKVKGKHQIFDACVTTSKSHFSSFLITNPISSINSQSKLQGCLTPDTLSIECRFWPIWLVRSRFAEVDAYTVLLC